MNQTLKFVGGIVLAILVVLGLVFGYIELYKEAAPKFNDAQRDVFENTQSFIHGKRQHLTKLKFEYETAKAEEHKTSLKQMILLEASNVDLEKLPVDLRTFIRGLQNPTFAPSGNSTGK